MIGTSGPSRYVGVVDAKSAERGHEVLDRIDLGFSAHEAGGQACFANGVGACRNVYGRREIDSTKYDAGVDRGRAQCHAHFATGVQSDARSADQFFESPLAQHFLTVCS